MDLFSVQAAGGGRFQAAAGDGGRAFVELRASELAMVLDGIDVSKLKRVRRYERGSGTNRDNKEDGVMRDSRVVSIYLGSSAQRLDLAGMK